MVSGTAWPVWEFGQVYAKNSNNLSNNGNFCSFLNSLLFPIIGIPKYCDKKRVKSTKIKCKRKRQMNLLFLSCHTYILRALSHIPVNEEGTTEDWKPLECLSGRLLWVFNDLNHEAQPLLFNLCTSNTHYLNWTSVKGAGDTLCSTTFMSTIVILIMIWNTENLLSYKLRGNSYY